MTLKKNRLGDFYLDTSYGDEVLVEDARVVFEGRTIFLHASEVFLTRDEAIKVRDALTAQIDSFVDSTFQEQYAELEPGDEFKVVWGNGSAWSRNIKLRDNLYFSFLLGNVLNPTNQRPDATVTKIGGTK